MKPRCIGIDPGAAKPSAFAWQDAAGVWTTALYHDARDIQYAMIRAYSHGVTHAVIEGCFLGRNSRSFGMLAVEQGRLRMAAELAGLRVVIADPRKWMRQSLVVSGHNAKTHKQLVAVAKLRAKAITGRITLLEDLTEDEAMAVCIADWGACNIGATS